MPATWKPISVTMATFGPGDIGEIANMSANCLSVIQRMPSTAMRCISGIAALAPPTANNDSVAKWTNNVVSGLAFIAAPASATPARCSPAANS